MNVFISWSGERSRQVAKLLHDWVKCVIQSSKPWMSSEDLSKGSVWFAKLSSELAISKIGIVCLTKSNKNNPWILYETGALTKGDVTNHVCTFLIDIEPEDLKGPLAHFNHTKPIKEDFLKLMLVINSNLSQTSLDDRALEKAFNTHWSDFELKFAKILLNTAEEEENIKSSSKKESESAVLPKELSDIKQLMLQMDKEKRNTDAIIKSQSPNYHISERAKLEMWGMDEAEIQRRLDLGMVLTIYAPKLEKINGKEIPKGFFGKKIDDKK